MTMTDSYRRGAARPRLVALVSMFVLLVWAWPARAGLVRHDRDPQAYANLAAAPGYASVGRLDVNRGAPAFVGTGTLIGDRWVLTAGHLLEDATTMSFTIGDRSYGAAGWVAHPKAFGSRWRENDLGLVELAEPVAGVSPAIRHRGKRERGQVATLVGYGVTGNGFTGANVLAGASDGVKRAGTNVFDEARKAPNPSARARLPKSSRILITDFDTPGNPADNATGGPEATDLEFLISVGDSGGGAFIDVGRGPELAGVHSFGDFFDERDDSDYGDVTGHIRVSSFNSWIDQTLRRGQNDPSRIRGFVRSQGVDTMAPSSAALMLEPSARMLVVPEPTGVALVGVGAGWLLLGRRRRR